MTTAPFASLPMYDWPESRAETTAFWADLRARAGVDLPDSLTVPDDVAAHWRDPALVFSQTCWGPLSLGLIDWVEPLAQPDYSVFPGGRGPFYRSALIARAGVAQSLGGPAPIPEGPVASLPATLLTGRCFALNSRDSLSGYLALREDLGADPCTLASACVDTGSHRGSVRAVTDGHADIAAIDCRSWALARRFEPGAADLIVVGWTAERFGLPYVASRASDPALVRALKETLLTMGCHPAPARRNE